MKVKYGILNDWSEEKLEFIRKYLNAYVTVFKLQRWASGVTYVDLFAGPGICYSKKNKKEVYGSPLIAWNVVPKFSDYYLCDNDHQNILRLTEHFKGISDVHIEEDDANNYINRLVAQLDPAKPTFIFLDPQSLNLHFKTIQTLISKIKIVDFLINFPAGQMLLRETAKKDCATCRGNTGQCSHCIEPVFENNSWKNLTGDYYNHKMKPTTFLRSILKLYMDPFERMGFKWAVKHVVNSTHAQMYDLIFASCNAYPAMKIMRDVMFSNGQLPLLPNTDELSRKIIDKYRGDAVSVLTLKDVLNDLLTGDNVYREKDIQDALKKLEAESRVRRLVKVSKRKFRFEPNEKFQLFCNRINENIETGTAKDIP